MTMTLADMEAIGEEADKIAKSKKDAAIDATIQLYRDHVVPAETARLILRGLAANGHTIRTLSRSAKWLELDALTGVYRECGDVPAERSQGAFPFGSRCATKTVGRRLP